MLKYMIPLRKKYGAIACLFIGINCIMGCRKESNLAPSDKDENYFVITDNPNDPVDHAIYAFYAATGIASFYNDTIHKKNIRREGEQADRFAYVKLAFTYHVQGIGTATGFRYVPAKNHIPGVLKLIEEDVLPKLPAGKLIPSIFLVDSFYTFNNPFGKKIAHGWTAIYGFNTVGIVVQNVSAMSGEEKKMYGASLLAGIAEKWLNIKYGEQLQNDFYKVTRDLMKSVTPAGSYFFLPYSLFVTADKIPPPEKLGLLYHPLVLVSNSAMVAVPTESMDMRAFLTAAFRYTAEEFSGMYAGHPSAINKFTVIRKLLQQANFKTP